MMDRSRFELTGQERVKTLEVYKKEHPDPELIIESDFGYVNRLLKAQVAKVLSMLEPVELEALRDEEIQKLKVNYSGNRESYLLRRLSQATIQKNQAKGQLYRRRSEKCLCALCGRAATVIVDGRWFCSSCASGIHE